MNQHKSQLGLNLIWSFQRGTVVETSVPLQELELRPKTLRERHQRNRALNTCENCPTDGRDVTGGWRNRPGSIKARAVEPASAFVIQQPLCVCLSISVGASFCWLCLTDTQDELHDSYKCKVILKESLASADRITGCVFLPANEKLSLLEIHTVCVLSAWEQSKRFQLSRELTARVKIKRDTACSLSEAFFE